MPTSDLKQGLTEQANDRNRPTMPNVSPQVRSVHCIVAGRKVDESRKKSSNPESTSIRIDAGQRHNVFGVQMCPTFKTSIHDNKCQWNT